MEELRVMCHHLNVCGDVITRALTAGELQELDESIKRLPYPLLARDAQRMSFLFKVMNTMSPPNTPLRARLMLPFAAQLKEMIPAFTGMVAMQFVAMQFVEN